MNVNNHSQQQPLSNISATPRAKLRRQEHVKANLASRVNAEGSKSLEGVKNLTAWQPREFTASRSTNAASPNLAKIAKHRFPKEPAATPLSAAAAKAMGIQKRGPAKQPAPEVLIPQKRGPAKPASALPQYGNIPKGEPKVSSPAKPAIQYDMLPADITYSKLPSPPPADTNFFTKADNAAFQTLKAKISDYSDYSKLNDNEKNYYYGQHSGQQPPAKPSNDELRQYTVLKHKREANLKSKLERLNTSPKSGEVPPNVQ